MVTVKPNDMRMIYSSLNPGSPLLKSAHSYYSCYDASYAYTFIAVIGDTLRYQVGVTSNSVEMQPI